MESNKEVIFILLAKGFYLNFPDSTGKVISQRAFRDKKSAEEYISTFRDKCINSDEFQSFSTKGLEIKIIELDLE
jgi:hypothetical protein